MKIYWSRVVVRSIVWLMSEIILSAIGIDDWADYSEYLFELDRALAVCRTPIVIVINEV